MDSKHYTLAKELFGEVCDLPESDRSTRLRQRTSNTGIIDYVEQLLLGQTETDHPRVSQPVMRMMSAVAGDDVKVGETLGAWRLVSEIGHGGMGTVFRAQRSDGHFEQEVAVKLLHGIPSAKSLEYLARERQILATLTHPNIARLYDGGTTPHGQPYLVMEYVEGIAIDRYVRDKHLPVHDILKLMIDVCGAIGFAHQRLIVHCDIKPSNILVTTSGRVVLLDFGIARLLDNNTRNDTAPHVAGSGSTQTVARAFTPQYASPEQRTGAVLTTATDVYSLGRMLRELLTIAGAAGDRNANAKHGLNKELRALISKAEAPDPTARYATAVAMAGDMERYLSHSPLKAVPATPAYLAQKLAQRNWPLIGASALIILTIAVAAQRILAERDHAQNAEKIAINERDATQLARAQAEQERDRAALAEKTSMQERDRAKVSESNALNERNNARQAERASKQTGDFLISIFENTSPNADAKDIPASKLLAIAEERLATQMQGQPALQAELYHTLGVVQKNMVAYGKSTALHQRAIALERKNNRPLVLARMLFQLVTTLHFDSNRNMALENAHEALLLRQKHLPPDAVDVGLSLSQVGSQLSLDNKTDDAKPYLQRGLAIVEKADPNSDNTAYALVNLAYYQRLRRDFPGAEVSLRRAISIRMALFGELNEFTQRAREQLGSQFQESGRYAESEAIARQNLAARLKMYTGDNLRVANVHFLLGESLQAQGRSREAVEAYEKAIAILAKGDSKGTSLHATATRNLANAYEALGDTYGAIKLLGEAQTHYRNLGTTRRIGLAMCMRTEGYLLTSVGRLDEAYQRLQEAQGLFKAVDVPNAAHIAQNLVYLLDWAGSAGKLEEAERLEAQLKPMLPLKDPNVQSQYLRANARIAELRGNLDEAMRGYEAAEAVQETASGQKSLNAWREKIYRAQLLKKRNQAGDRAASAALAKEILGNVTGKLASASPFLVQVRDLAAQQL